MKIEYLIQKIEDMFNVATTNFEYKIYDSLKMDNEELDVNKINGLARIVSGSVEPIQNLGQANLTLSIEFIYPYERIDAVNETCRNVAAMSAGLVIDNSSLNAELNGTTGIAISYPVQGNYYNGTVGESAKSRIICYFDINEKAVLSNKVKYYITNTFSTVDIDRLFTIGTYYKLENGQYISVQLPQDYDFDYGNNYYERYDYEYSFGILDYIYTESGGVYTPVANWPEDYVPETRYYYREMTTGNWEVLPSHGTYWQRSDYQVNGQYVYTEKIAPYEIQLEKRYYTPKYRKIDVKISEGEYFYLDGDYILVHLPQQFQNGVTYYQPSNYEEIPYVKAVLTRHRISTTNKYLNDTEMRTVNDGQSIDISLVVPSIKDSLINIIKDDMVHGLKTQAVYQLKMLDESGYTHNFYNMMASGDFSYETTPGEVALFKILFVYKRA